MSDSEQFSLFNLPDSNGSPPSPPQASPPLGELALIPTSAQVPIPPGTFQTMADLQEPCSHCQRCELGQSRTHAVIGRGNPQASLMLIGEGPGQHEDEQGLPFVGKSGQLLDKILASVNFNPAQDVYICNVVKCRPPGNRKPEPPEMAACLPYLLEQIRLMDPKLILLVGATAVQGILGSKIVGKAGISKLRGQWYTWQDAQGKERLCMPIFHPSYLLRNQSREKGSPKWLTWQDIQAVRTKYDELVF